MRSSVRVRGERGLEQVLAVTPPPPLFLKVGCKKGGHNRRAVRYMNMYLGKNVGGLNVELAG